MVENRLRCPKCKDGKSYPFGLLTCPNCGTKLVTKSLSPFTRGKSYSRGKSAGRKRNSK
jgi:DNA-directed RNA polymerase subunit RPC12/RpoP